MTNSLANHLLRQLLTNRFGYWDFNTSTRRKQMVLVARNTGKT